MSLPLNDEEETRYTQIIDGILATANLETVTRKKVRLGLENALGGLDLGPQKTAIKELIEQRFDAISSGPAEASADSASKHRPNGHDEHEDPEGGDEIKVSIEQPKAKKRKLEDETEDADAKLAAMLQAQENKLGARATRGGGTAKPAKKKKTPRKKSSKKIGHDDDSDVDGSEESGPKRKAGGGFQKPFNLSSPLADVCGETQLPRPQVVKKLWEYIRANELQDPNDKRQIRCDEKFHAVFKQAKVDMFQMNRIISDHLYPVDE